MRKVSVVIPACNERDWVRRTVKSLVELGGLDGGWGFEPIDHEYVIVDDASQDGCCDQALLEGIIKGRGRLVIFRNEERQGVGQSRNRGLDAADGDYAIVADAHVEQKEPGTARRLVQHAEDDQCFAVAQVRGMGKGGLRHGGRFLFMRQKYVGWRYLPPNPAPSYPIDVPNGGFYAFSMDLRKRLGLWPNDAALWGHGPVSKGLLCWFTGTPSILYKDCQIAHRYGDVDYSFPIDSQWRNAAAVYAIVFDADTYWHYWHPILAPVVGGQFLQDLWERQTEKRAAFHAIKQFTDAQFFRDALRVPIERGALESVKSVPKVAVVIPAFNAGKELALTVASIRAADDFDHEIVVVDDASTDGCASKLPLEEKPTPFDPTDEEHVKLVAEDRRLMRMKQRQKGCYLVQAAGRAGVAACRGAGMRAAEDLFKPDVFLFSDAEARWDSGTVKALAEAAVNESMLVRPFVMAAFANWTETPNQAAEPVYGGELKMRPERALGIRYVRERGPKVLDRDLQSTTGLCATKAVIGSVYAAHRSLFRLGGGPLEWFNPPFGAIRDTALAVGWGYAELMISGLCAYHGIPMVCQPLPLALHKLQKDRSTDTGAMLCRAWFAHALLFGGMAMARRLFAPALDQIGILVRPGGWDEMLALERAILCRTAKLTPEQAAERLLPPEMLVAFRQAIKDGLMDEKQTEPEAAPPVKPETPKVNALLPHPHAIGAVWDQVDCGCEKMPFVFRFGGKAFAVIEGETDTKQSFCLSLDEVVFCPYCGKRFAELEGAQPMLTIRTAKHLRRLQYLFGQQAKS